jgi:hypothetical protein
MRSDLAVAAAVRDMPGYVPVKVEKRRKVKS